ncbi:Mu-like prophage major head subunit [Paramagnetospirillum caucaseum]|uniref:Mu-like prophage major head subunit n=1 Tax=Paramagnetospirillum caucaseum TaxID=1244869 RepID=M3AEV8_9PROT|nr:Mu-like prophage major head subunit gpT family protein [Paramagnetospirillum caucaseum]EME71393.1 Mu-like prophage major head subunit [Paramagnetospirillum caucaseum]
MTAFITERSARGMFYERLQQTTALAWTSDLSAYFDSDQDSEDYPWLGQVPMMGESRGSKKFAELNDFAWTIRNVPYQTGIKLPESHVLNDKTGQVQARVSEMADSTSTHWADLLAPLIVNGAATVCYDGQYYYDSDHVSGASGTQSNLVSVDISALPVNNHGSATAPSAAEFVHCVMQGVQRLITFKDDQGRYCNEGLTEFLVMTPPTLMLQANAALRASSIDGNDTNILVEQDSFRLRFQATPRLSSWTDSFSLFALGGVRKPFVRQQKVPTNGSLGGYDSQGIRIQQLWLDSEHCVKNGECLMSVDTVRAAAYGEWLKSVKVTMT